jgi:hypothetical protein
MVRYAVADTPYISILIILFLLPFVQSVCYVRAVALHYFCKVFPPEAEGLRREKKRRTEGKRIKV